MRGWDRRFMQEAELKASWSKDRSRQVGCVIVNDDDVVVSSGWNGFPRGINDDVESRHERPAKYEWTEHAERNAIYNAARIGVPLKGTTMYCTLFSCAPCVRSIIQSGVVRLVCPEPDWNDSKYKESLEIAREMLKEAGVVIQWYYQEPTLFQKFEEYCHRYQYTHKVYRWGQCCFNTLLLFHEDIAEDVRGSDLDPFYVFSRDSEVITNFMQYVEQELDCLEEKEKEV